MPSDERFRSQDTESGPFCAYLPTKKWGGILGHLLDLRVFVPKLECSDASIAATRFRTPSAAKRGIAIMNPTLRLAITATTLWFCAGMECDNTASVQAPYFPAPIPCGCAEDVAATIEMDITNAESALADDVWQALNDHRVALGLGELNWYNPAADVAHGHSNAMLERDFFDHVDPCTCLDQSARAAVAGIEHDAENLLSPVSNTPFVGEVIYRATRINNLDGAHIVNVWVQSPEHRVHVEAPMQFPGFYKLPDWTHCGVGVRIEGDETYVTAMFFKNPTTGAVE